VFVCIEEIDRKGEGDVQDKEANNNI